jgi:hypothetical protein
MEREHVSPDSLIFRVVAGHSFGSRKENAAAVFDNLVLMSPACSQNRDAIVRHGCGFLEVKPVIRIALPPGLMRIEEHLSFRGDAT